MHESLLLLAGVGIGLVIGLVLCLIVFWWGWRWQQVVRTHNLCHNLQGQVGAEEFAQGCAEEQRKLFGCAPHADKVEQLQHELKAQGQQTRRRTQWG